MRSVNRHVVFALLLERLQGMLHRVPGSAHFRLRGTVAVSTLGKDPVALLLQLVVPQGRYDSSGSISLLTNNEQRLHMILIESKDVANYVEEQTQHDSAPTRDNERQPPTNTSGRCDVTEASTCHGHDNEEDCAF